MTCGMIYVIICGIICGMNLVMINGMICAVHVAMIRPMLLPISFVMNCAMIRPMNCVMIYNMICDMTTLLFKTYRSDIDASFVTYRSISFKKIKSCRSLLLRNRVLWLTTKIHFLRFFLTLLRFYTIFQSCSETRIDGSRMVLCRGSDGVWFLYWCLWSVEHLRNGGTLVVRPIAQGVPGKPGR